MQENEDSDQQNMPNVQPPLLPQNTMPPDDYYAGSANNQIQNAANNTGMPAGFSGNVEPAAVVPGFGQGGDNFNQYQNQMTEEAALQMAINASMQQQ